MTLYKATIEFLSLTRTCEGRSSTIQYEAASHVDAAKDAMRWAKNRHEAGIFGKPTCIKIYEVFPQKVDDTGYLPIETGMNFFEWKIDTGPFEYRLAELESLVTKRKIRRSAAQRKEASNGN